MTARADLVDAKRVVVKIGSRLIADAPASRPATIAEQLRMSFRRFSRLIMRAPRHA